MNMCVCVPSHLSCVQLFATLLIVAHQVLCPWDSSGKNTGVLCYSLLQEIFLTQESNLSLLCLLHWLVGSLPLAPSRKLKHMHIFIYICISTYRYKCIDIHMHRQRGSKKNIFLRCQWFSSHSDLQPICLLRKSSNVSRMTRDLRWTLYGQLQLRSGLTPACTCFQSLQLLQKPSLKVIWGI